MARTRADKHKYHFEEIVVGGDLPSLLYCYYTGKKALFTKSSPPFMFDEVPGDIIPGVSPEHGNTFPAIRVWEYLIFVLGLNGQIIGSGLNRSIRRIKNELKITTEFSRLTRIRFDKLIVMDPADISGIPLPRKKVKAKSTVYDWFNVRRGTTHPYTHKEWDRDFMKEVWWYNSKRFMSHGDKDCVFLSELDDKQLKKFDYSETALRILGEDLFKELGINDYPILEHAGREIKQNITYKYDEHDLVQYVAPDLDYIIKYHKPEEPSKYVQFFPPSRHNTSRFQTYWFQTSLG